MIILAFNNVDGTARGVLLQSIKVDLQLNDIRVGVLSGIAFALFYSFIGIPIAHWADRGNRVTIIEVTTRYLLGVPLALTIDYFGAGWLNTHFHWRITFVLLALPVLALGAISLLVLREPRRADDSPLQWTPLHLGTESLRWALICLCPGYLWAASHLWRAGTTVTDELQPDLPGREIPQHSLPRVVPIQARES